MQISAKKFDSGCVLMLTLLMLVAIFVEIRAKNIFGERVVLLVVVVVRMS